MSKSKQQTEELASVIAAELRDAKADVEQALGKRAGLDQIIESAQERLQTIEQIWRHLPTQGLERRDVERLRFEAEIIRKRTTGCMTVWAMSRETRGLIGRMASRGEKFAARVESLLPASAK